MSHRLPLTALLILLPASGLADTVMHRTGQAVELHSGQPIYREEHEQRYDGRRWLGGHIRYIGNDGRLLGDKTLDFSQDPYVPLMRFSQPVTDSQDSITQVDDHGIRLESRYQGKRTSTLLPREPGQVADAGFNAYVADHLPELMQGQTLHMSFIVVARQAQYRFRITPDGRLTQSGEPAIRLRVEPDSLLRWVVPPLTLVYGTTSRQLLNYEGLSNITNPQTGKVWEARIRFTPDSP